MKNFRYAFFASVLLMLCISTSNAQWVQTSEDPVNCIALSGTNLFAGTRQGIILSTDSGNSWVAVNTGLTTTWINALAVKDTNIFAGSSGGGVFLSTDNGTNWTAVNNGLPSNTIIYSLAISSTNLFAGTYQNGVYLSTDNGANWTAVNDGLPSGAIVQSLAVSSTNVFAGTISNGIFISTDNGTSWIAKNSGLTCLSIDAIFSNGTDLFAGIHDCSAFRSTDNGTNWTAIGLENRWILSFGVSGVYLFAGTFNGIFLSTNNGSDWKGINTGLSKGDVKSLKISDNTLFAGTESGVYKLSLTGPNIILNTSSLDFEAVSVGESATQSIAITNIGTTNTLSITGVTSIDNYSVESDPLIAYPINLAPGASQGFDVTFAPTSRGPVSGNIMFAHNAVDGSTGFSVTGIGLAGGVQFKVPFLFKQNGVTDSSTLWIGISGDGPGGVINDNTYTLDEDPAFGDYGYWRESFYWSDLPGNLPDFMAMAVNIPGRIGITPNDSYDGLYPYDFRGFTSTSQVDTFSIDFYGDHVQAVPVNISWPNNLRQYGFEWVLKKTDDYYGETWDVIVPDMTTVSSYTDPNTSNKRVFHYLLIKTGAFTPTTGTGLSLKSGWNLVSVPFYQIGSNADVLFPGKFGSMFSYNPSSHVYEESPLLSSGQGYWIYYTAPANVFFNIVGGSPITVSCQTGWNLIGSRNTAVNVAALIVDNGATIFGDVFRYNCISHTYQSTTVINPAEAVWIYVLGDCTITIP